MRLPGPVALLLLTGALALSVALRAREPPGPPPRPAEAARLPPDGASTPPAESGADLAGEVSDRRGRLVPGATVLVEREDGTTVAAVEADGCGRFALRAGGGPPLVVRLASSGEGIRVDRLPCLDLELVDGSAVEAGAGDLVVRVVVPDGTTDAVVTVLLRDDLGEDAGGLRGRLSAGPFVFPDRPFGTYDILVRGEGRAGSRRGFPFTAGAREASVPVGAAASVRGLLSRPARARLLPDPPSTAVLSRSQREADGVDGVVREALAEAGGGEAFHFEGLPAGAFRLRLCGEGVESREIPLVLVEGEARNLGRIDLEEAAGVLTVAIDEGRPAREYAYLVEVWSPLGLRLEREVPADGPGTAVFAGLSAGEWFFRAGRMLGGRHHTQAAGWHRRVEVAEGAEVLVTADCRW